MISDWIIDWSSRSSFRFLNDPRIQRFEPLSLDIVIDSVKNKIKSSTSIMKKKKKRDKGNETKRKEKRNETYWDCESLGLKLWEDDAKRWRIFDDATKARCIRYRKKFAIVGQYRSSVGLWGSSIAMHFNRTCNRKYMYGASCKPCA